MECSVSQAAPVCAAIFALLFGLIALAVAALMVWAYCKIFAKAGYSWALGLLMLVPVANIIMPLVLAFSDWPIQKQLRLLEQQQSSNAG